MTKYQNPWHDPYQQMYGPECYQTDEKPTIYRGFFIYHRTPLVWDVVKDGVCVTQRAGINGAKHFIDDLIDRNYAYV